jgi:translation initiation factor 2A
LLPDERTNRHATALLAKTETAIDTSGQSYYGESILHLIHADGEYDCIVLPTKEGMVQDVKWSPTGNNFVLIGGRMPANATLFDFRGEPKFEFGQKHRNTIKWSPSGRFLVLGGFGNLAGDVDFWDVNKRALIGHVNAHSAVTTEWAPDGRTFMFATLSPRIVVDNGYTLYNYRGELIHKQDWPGALYACDWRPAARDVYPDRPQSPGKGRPASSTGGAAAKAAPVSPAKGAYRAPGSSGSLAAMMRGERESSGVSAGSVKYVAPGRNGSIPGLAAVVPKKKTRKRGKKPATPAVVEEPELKEEVKVEDPAKVLKKSLKLMRQIDDLLALQAKGETLTPEQLTKIGRKSEIEAQMAKLQV